MIERALGEKFEYNGVILKVMKEKESCCEGCYFCENSSPCDNFRAIIGPCGFHTRSDGHGVIFKRLKSKKSIRSTKAVYERNEKDEQD